MYKQSEGSLDIYAPRNTQYISALQAIFAQCILKADDLDPFASENMTYQLDALANRQFTFIIDANSGIEQAVVSLLRLSLLNGKKRRITIQVDPSHDSTAIYDLLESLNLPNFHVSQVEIKITFSASHDKQKRTRKVKISHPNWCGLKHDGEDELIRQMLAASGIVPIKNGS